LKESDFDWFDRDSEQVTSSAKHYQNKLDLLKKIFRGTGFEVRYHHTYQHSADIWKDDGQYSNFALHRYPMEWLGTASRDYSQAENICGKDCDLTLVQKDIYNILAQYINDNILPEYDIYNRPKPRKLIESDELDWIKDVPNVDPLAKKVN
jgi:hypothetical protein